MADKTIHTFTGATPDETLELVKQKLGKNAFILNMRKIKKGGFLGIGAKMMVEITATDQADVVMRHVKSERPAASSPVMKLLDKTYKMPPPVTASTARERAIEGEIFVQELAEIKSMIRNLQSKVEHRDLPAGSEELTEAYIRLLQNDVAEVLARGLVQRLQENLVGEEMRSREAVLQALTGYIAKLIPTSGGIKLRKKNGPTVCMFVGPTGVGKTTTISKLAAFFTLRENKKVGLLTADTFRLGAELQLRQCAEILKIPMKVVNNPLDAERLVNAYSNMDLVLIDTAGRSQRDKMKMNELEQLFETCHPDETHLVLNGVSQPGHLHDVIEQFSRFRIDRILMTKLDEAINFGIVLNVIAKTHRFAGQETTLSYITTGQNVPNDIEVGDAQRLAKLILGGKLEK